MFIFISGFPVPGRLEIADELAKLLPGARVINDWQFIQFASLVFDHNSPDFDDLRANLRRTVLKSISGSSSIGKRPFIFTDYQAPTKGGVGVAKEYQNAAAKCGSSFYSIVLRSSQEEKHMEPGELHYFGGTNEIQLDVASMMPDQTAATILKFVTTLRGGGKQRPAGNKEELYAMMDYEEYQRKHKPRQEDLEEMAVTGEEWDSQSDREKLKRIRKQGPS